MHVFAFLYFLSLTPAARLSDSDLAATLDAHNQSDSLGCKSEKIWVHEDIGMEFDFIRQRDFVLPFGEGLPDGPKTPVVRWLVLTSDYLLVYRCSTNYCAKSNKDQHFCNEGCTYADDQPAVTFHISTFVVSDPYTMHEQIGVEEEPPPCRQRAIATYGNRSHYRECVALRGGARIDGKLYQVNVPICLSQRQSNKYIEGWKESIDEAYLKFNKIAGDRLKAMISEAFYAIETQMNQESMAYHLHILDKFIYYDDAEIPRAFSPVLCPISSGVETSNDARSDAQDEYTKAFLAFEMGTPIPYNAGKNSRSGASFFWAAGKNYIAKRVRSFEYKALWDLSKKCDYHKRLADQQHKSLINPIYLAFSNAGQHWIVMRAEVVPIQIKTYLPPEGVSWRKDFFNDIKPGAMTSDRKEFANKVMYQSISKGLHLASSAEQAIESLRLDTDLLDRFELVDYSLLVYGTILELNFSADDSREFFKPLKDGHLDRRPSLHALDQVVKTHPNCAFKCNKRPKELIDLTPYLTQGDSFHLERNNGEKYKCCCVDIETGGSSVVKSPCALINVASNWTFFGNKGCGTLIGKGFHSYFRKYDTLVNSGKCLVRQKGFMPSEDMRMFYGEPEALHFRFLDPTMFLAEVLQNPRFLSASIGVSPPLGVTCMLTCVSVLDYLLKLTFWKDVENIALVPLYGEKKWSNYADRIKNLLWCIADSQVKMDPLRKNSDMSLFFDEPPWNHKESAKTCKEVFPDIEHSVDAKVVRSLLWKTWKSDV